MKWSRIQLQSSSTLVLDAMVFLLTGVLPTHSLRSISTDPTQFRDMMLRENQRPAQ